MAKIDAVPLPETVAALRGQLDYAVWKGRPYARSWPRKPAMPRSPAVQASAAEFARLSRALGYSAPQLIAQAKEDTQGEAWTWKEELTAAAYGNLVIW